MAPIDTTTDLRPLRTLRLTRADPRVRTATVTAGLVGAGLLGLLWLFASGRPDPHGFAARVLIAALLLLALVGYITLSTRSAVAQLRQEIVAATVAQVSAICAEQVAEVVRGRQYRAAVAVPRFELLVEQQDALTREVARQRGQLSIGLRELAEAVERVEARVTADIAVAYDLGAQSTRD